MEPSRGELLEKIRVLEARLAELEGEKRAARDAGARDNGEGVVGMGGDVGNGDYEGLGLFVGTIIHDLNNLLSAVLGNAGLALMDLSPFSSCHPLIQEVEEAAQRAAVLANQMLALSGQTLPESAPMARVTAEPSGLINMPQPITTSWRGEGLMLVVDDELMVRILAKRVLEKFGFQVMTAEDGERAVEIFRPHAPEFVGVLLDVTMPKLDGAATFRELRQLRPDLKVILSSGYDERQATQRIAREGLAGFLPKPYLPMDLIEKVREALD